MAPATHERISLASIVGIALVSGVWGVIVYGAQGLLALVPGLVVAGLVHHLVIERLPVECPDCESKVAVRFYGYDFPVDSSQTAESWYTCPNCPYQRRGRF